MVDTSRVDGALRRSQDHLLGLQVPAGYWLGELEADTTITSEYLLLRHLLGTPDPELERKGVAYLRERQGADGSWTNAGSGRWMEKDPVLVTSYSVLALTHLHAGL